MTEAGIHAGWFGDTYIALGGTIRPIPRRLGGALALQTAGSMDLAAVLMALGGMLAILDMNVIVRCAHGNSARLWPRLHHDQSAALYCR